MPSCQLAILVRFWAWARWENYKCLLHATSETNGSREIWSWNSRWKNKLQVFIYLLLCSFGEPWGENISRIVARACNFFLFSKSKTRIFVRFPDVWSLIELPMFRKRVFYKPISTRSWWDYNLHVSILLLKCLLNSQWDNVQRNPSTLSSTVPWRDPSRYAKF